jgi:hypothetical protein
VRAGCLEAVLGLAIYAKRHADVWDAAAALLRDHSAELSAHRQVGGEANNTVRALAAAVTLRTAVFVPLVWGFVLET